MTGRNYYRNRHEIADIIFKAINKDEAKERIREYVTENPGSLTSQIIETLKIDPITTTNALEELKNDGLVLNKAVE